MTNRHHPTPATTIPSQSPSTGSSGRQGEFSPTTESGNAADMALPTTVEPLASGPIFSASDYQRALEALDLVLQNYAWKQGDNYLIVGSLFGTLSEKGITLALAQALFDWLIEHQIFQPWSKTIPAGCSYEGGVRVLRPEPQTVRCLVTTRKRWYGFLAERKQLRNTVKPYGDLGGDNPYQALLNFAWRVHAEEHERLNSLAGTRRPLPEEWGPHFRMREQELQRLVDAALRAAERTGFEVIDVERRVRALAQTILSILLWPRDTPPSTLTERERLESAGVWQQAASDYLGTHYRAMVTAWEAMQALAVRSEGLPGPSSDGKPGVSVPLAPPPRTPSESASAASEYLEFSTKQRQLLLLLFGQGAVAITKIKKRLYGTSATASSTLEQLVKRTNQKLSERGYRQEIKRKSNTYALQSL